MTDIKGKIQILQKLRRQNVYKKFIEYIRYPRFRNLEDNTKIEFKFPITFLVGKNGGGKSSTLQSLYGCPQGYSLGDYWFTTELDPIKEFEDDRNCFIYGYNVSGGLNEVLKHRIYREGNPDYWEPSKPVKKYGMTNKRVSPISKDVEYIDFRSELSAFDKYMHFTSFSSSSRYLTKQDYLRFYTRKLKSAIENNNIVTLRGYDRNKLKVILNQEQIDIINYVLGKKYTEIEIIEHNLFKDWGFSIRLKSSELHYSEAFAGSGETAIVLLVYKIFNTKEESLILLDEPETSLHSGAQKRLMSFILDVCIKKKHQFVISTHSPFLIENMPDEAIKVFSTISTTGKFIVNNERSYKEAFYELEIENNTKKSILVEDKTAKLILEKVLDNLGKSTKDIFEIKYLPGGASDINQRLTTIMEISDDVFVLFDGDQKKIDEFIDLQNLPLNQQDTSKKLKELIKTQTGCEVKFHLDGGNQDNEIQEIELSKKYLNYYKEKVFYFPTDLPEEIIWDKGFAQNLLKILHPNKNINAIVTKSKDAKELIFNFCLECYNDSQQLESVVLQFITNWLNKKDENYKSLVKIINEIK